MPTYTKEQRAELVERLNKLAEGLKWHNASYAQDVLRAVDVLLAPPVAAPAVPDGVNK